MKMGDLTDVQTRFVEVPSMNKAFVGGRQVGMTTALCFDALTDAEDGMDVAVTAPTHRQAMLLMDKARDILDESSVVSGVTTENKSRIDIRDGGSVKAFVIHPNSNDGPDPAKYDKIVIDEIDYISSEDFDQIIDSFHGEGARIAVAGTPKYISPNISRLVEGELDGGWYTVFDDMYNVDHTQDEFVDAHRETLSPEQTITEINGMIVKDPREMVDYTGE